MIYVFPIMSRCQLCDAGSFGAMDPASHDLYMFLEKLQQQQKEVINLIKERQRIIAVRDGTPIPPGPVFVPAGSPVPPLPAAAAAAAAGAALKEKAAVPACESKHRISM